MANETIPDEVKRRLVDYTIPAELEHYILSLIATLTLERDQYREGRDKWKALASNHEFCPRSSELALDVTTLQSRLSRLEQAAEAYMMWGGATHRQALIDALAQESK